MITGGSATAEGSYRNTDLLAISAIRGKDREVVIDGMIPGWDPRPEKMISAVRRYQLPPDVRWRADTASQWRLTLYPAVLTHLPSGRQVKIENLPDGRVPPVVAATEISSDVQLVVFGAGDPKAGPHPAYWAYLFVRGLSSPRPAGV